MLCTGMGMVMQMLVYSSLVLSRHGGMGIQSIGTLMLAHCEIDLRITHTRGKPPLIHDMLYWRGSDAFITGPIINLDPTVLRHSTSNKSNGNLNIPLSLPNIGFCSLNQDFKTTQ